LPIFRFLSGLVPDSEQNVPNMNKISLTDFVDIASKSGTPKATKVAQVKARPDYDPRFDFYKQIREQITELHKCGQDSATLRIFLQTLTDRKKIANYPELVDGYLKWLGRKVVEWSEPPRRLYRSSGIEVIVNPELCVSFGKETHVIKLYLKDDPLDRFKVEVILSLMEDALRPYCAKNATMSVLDVRRAKLFSWRASSRSRMALVDAELAYVASLWPNV
jgi:hypothetical protein